MLHPMSSDATHIGSHEALVPTTDVEKVPWSYDPNVWGCAAWRIFDRAPFAALDLATTAETRKSFTCRRTRSHLRHVRR
jgi:hypothetical protein